MIPATAKAKEIQGRKYDVKDGEILSRRDKDFLACINEFAVGEVREFIEYIMSGEPLSWEWNDGGCGKRTDSGPKPRCAETTE